MPQASQVAPAATQAFRNSTARERIRAGFAAYAESSGLIAHAPGGLIPEHDASVLFTGATISTLKPYLENARLPDEGYYLLQNCLRTQNANILRKDGLVPRWCSYFSSFGTLMPYSSLAQAARLAWELFAGSLAIPETRLAIRISSRDHDMLGALGEIGLGKKLHLDTEPDLYYRHRFGMEGVLGRNCNLAIADPRTGEHRDVGNLIVIEVRDIPVAVELAFGIETVSCHLGGLGCPIKAALIADILPTDSEAELKLADALAASVVILRNGIRPISTNRGRVLRKYLQGISHLRRLTGLDLEGLTHAADRFERMEFGTGSDLGRSIASYLSDFERMESEGLAPADLNARLSGHAFGQISAGKPEQGEGTC